MNMTSPFDDDFVDDVVNSDSGNTVVPPASAAEILTDDEKKRAIDAWNSGVSDLKTIIAAACGDSFDGRSKKGMAVKKYLAEQNLKARPSHIYVKKSASIVLTDENKEFIANNAAAMKPLEITRVLFDDSLLTPLSSEFRIVKEFYDSLDLKVKAQSEDENTKDYNPPKTEQQALSRINKYVLDGIDVQNITPRQREAVHKLIRFMHTHSFLVEINNLPLNSERELFESAFVRFVYDKPDLTEEEIHLYLNQCSDIVSYQRMQKELVILTDAVKSTMESDQKVPMAIVEAIGKLRSNIDDNLKRQKTTLNDLNGKRANRLDKLHSNSESVLKLIEAFRNEASRKRIIDFVEEKKAQVKEEVKRLTTMDELKFQIWGAAPEEVS